MVGIKIRDGEDIEGALRRFKRIVQQEGVLKELKRRRHHTPPSVRRQEKKKEALRRQSRQRRRSR
jgi:small subunit ribosomal protein S21